VGALSRVEEFTRLSPFPLFIAQDLEAGQTAGGPIWPSAMAVSSADSPEDAYRWAFLQGKQARSFGVNAAFGPVLDVALSDLAENTGYRSVGSDPSRVAEYCAEMVRGYQDAGVLPFAKHYPGFGRAQGDPHMELSVIDPDYGTLCTEELLPYRKAIADAGLMGVMSGHVLAENVDSLPATVSKKLIDILRCELGFDGLLMTDSLAMQGILHYDSTPNLYKRAILAGHDIILANYNLPDADVLDYLEESVNSGSLPLALVEEKVRRILAVKLQLEEFRPLPWSEEENTAVFDRIAAHAPAFVRRDGGAFEPLDPGEKYYCVFFTEEQAAVEGELSGERTNTGKLCDSLRAAFPHMKIDILPPAPVSAQIQRTLKTALGYEKVIVIARTAIGAYTGHDSLMPQMQSLIRALSRRLDTLVLWGTPFAVRPIRKFVPQMLFIYDSRRPVLDRLLTGELAPQGKLPVEL